MAIKSFSADHSLWFNATSTVTRENVVEKNIIANTVRPIVLVICFILNDEMLS